MHQQTRERVATVIPVYRAHFLADCLASVFAQTRQPDRVIVVDDGSPERATIERAVLPYGDRVTLIRQVNRGAGAARNRGILASDTDLIAFLDADDEWAPEFLQGQLHLMRAYRFAVVYANGDIVGDSPLSGMRFMETAPSQGTVNVEALLSQRCTVLTSSVVVRRKLLLDVGLFDEDLRRGQDFDLWVRLAAAGATFAYTTAPLVRRRIHSQNLSGDCISELERAVAVLLKLREKRLLTAAQGEVLDTRVRVLRAQIATEQGKKTLLAGNLPEARSQFRLAAAAGGGWKTRIVGLALQLAPVMTRQAYLFKLRRDSPAPPIQTA
jgi:glycosyltransferase involved in cell wall biosynthesis